MGEPGPAAAPPAALDPAANEAPPRKRRRRAPTTGASVDCFACQQEATTCDRRRPYCTQCIDRGKTCSGYKTQLTWGVGVASRGKLRGLSLPVAASAAKKSAGSGDGIKSTSGKASSPPTPKAVRNGPPIKTEPVESPVIAPPPTFTPNPPAFQFGASSQPDDPSSSTASQPQFTWSMAGVPPPIPASRSQTQKKPIRRHSLQPLQMPPNAVAAMMSPMPMTAGVYGGFPFGYPESAVVDSPPAPYQYHDRMGGDKQYQMSGSYGRFPDGYRSGYSSSSWRSDTMSTNLSSNPSSHDLTEEEYYRPDMGPAHMGDTPNSAAPQSAYQFPYTDFVLPEEFEEAYSVEYQPEQPPFDPNTALSLSTPRSLQGPLVGKTANLRELIHYYDQVIAPVILAFDGPTNPWRTHIIRLASGSDALQHAIAALSSSNLRMRRVHEPFMPAEQKLLADSSAETRHDVSVRKSSIAHSILREQVDPPEDFSQMGKHSQRELYHKGEAIKALNAELSQLRINPGGSDDTVLATLLVLCLYHICDTGVAKFRTQFAGVKKLIALRNRRSKSRDSNWLLLLFKWFDAITSTVNDREAQFEEYIDDDDLDEWALENLAGCDGRILKIISKLGRLNLLSQGKSVGDGMSTPRAQPPRPPQFDYVGPNGSFEGNSGAYLPVDSNPLARYPQFAAEWFAQHQALLDWQFDSATIPPTMRSSAAANPAGDPDVIDLRHISESFRYSALLYLERIAHPAQTSSAPSFCVLVEQAIYHIRAVKSDVYLLWPLFITGSECVSDDHRNLIRQRCRSIQSDSGFYNNTSTLDLLERTWQEKDRAEFEGHAGDPRDGPFKWRKNMASGEEEYIVI